jgi:hypothetical protein
LVDPRKLVCFAASLIAHGMWANGGPTFAGDLSVGHRLGRISGIAATVAPLFRREPDSSPRRHWKETELPKGDR